MDNIISWVEDEKVTEYMNESAFAGSALRELRRNVDESLLTCQLNRDGYFSLICDEKTDEPVGFVRFACLKDDRYEIVYAVGKTDIWGLGIGGEAVDSALYDIFLEKRASAVYARVYPENVRSVGIIKNRGFRLLSDSGKTNIYALTKSDYMLRLA